jgi:hypothetical protein
MDSRTLAATPAPTSAPWPTWLWVALIGAGVVGGMFIIAELTPGPNKPRRRKRGKPQLQRLWYVRYQDESGKYHDQYVHARTMQEAMDKTDDEADRAGRPRDDSYGVRPVLA